MIMLYLQENVAIEKYFLSLPVAMSHRNRFSLQQNDRFMRFLFYLAKKLDKWYIQQTLSYSSYDCLLKNLVKILIVQQFNMNF